MRDFSRQKGQVQGKWLAGDVEAVLHNDEVSETLPDSSNAESRGF